MMANKKKKESWLDCVKRFFRLDARSRSEKKERRRKWAFQRLQNRRFPTLVGPSQGPNAEELEQSKGALNVAIPTAAAAEAAVTAAHIAAEAFKLSSGVQIPNSKQENHESSSVTLIRNDMNYTHAPEEHQSETKVHNVLLEAVRIKATITIQAAFRGYLAKKALRALKGIVKLQAIIRGRAVRRQAMVTLKRLQSIVNIHSNVCATRSNVVARAWNYSEHCQIKQWKDKVKKMNIKRWDDSLLPKDKEDAIFLSKQEAVIKRERIQEYSFSHRKSAESENRKPNGRWRYWLEQWVDTQLNKNREFEDLDHVIPCNNIINPKSKDNQEINNNGIRRQLKPRSSPIVQQTPVMSGSRSRHKKQCSMGDDNFHSSPSVPTYMAATESARAKARSLSSPRLRPGAFDAYSDSYSPYKNKLSLVSSVVSEVPILGCGYRGHVKLVNGGQHQRSPSLKGFPSAVKSGRVTKDLIFG